MNGVQCGAGNGSTWNRYGISEFNLARVIHVAQQWMTEQEARRQEMIREEKAENDRIETYAKLLCLAPVACLQPNS